MEYGLEKQKLLIESLLADESVFQRCHNILKSIYFDKELQSTVAFILKHADEYSTLPTIKQIYAETEIQLDVVDLRDQDKEWTLKNIEQFCRWGAIVQAIYQSPDLIDRGDYGAVEKMVKEAVIVGLQRDLGVDYFVDPRSRLERMLAKNLIPTGWADIDRKLYGGMNRGELTIFAAASGGGKSLFLQNLCLNWVEGTKYAWGGDEKEYGPLNVVYVTLELSEELVSKRMDTMVTGIDAREIFKRLDDVELKVSAKGKKCGHLQIKYMSAGSTCNDLRAYLKEFEIQTGIRPDAIAVDYLDLLHPSRKKVDLGDLYIKDKYVTEELRALASELDILCASASQLNRSAVDEQEHSHSMIAGGLSKIQTADNVVSIYASQAMREREEVKCQFLKTRSSSGVGSSVYLRLDLSTLRISNMDQQPEEDGSQPTLREKLKQEDILNRVKKPNIGITMRPTAESNTSEDEDSSQSEKIEDSVIEKPKLVEAPTERLKRLLATNKH